MESGHFCPPHRCVYALDTLTLVMSVAAAIAVLGYVRLTWIGFVTIDIMVQGRVYLRWLTRTAAVAAAMIVLALGMGVGGAESAAMWTVWIALASLAVVPPALTTHFLASRAQGQVLERRRRMVSKGKRIRRRPMRRWVARGRPQEQPSEAEVVPLRSSSRAS